MSEINIYINDEDKVRVKDDTQIIKMKGDKCRFHRRTVRSLERS